MTLDNCRKHWVAQTQSGQYDYSHNISFGPHSNILSTDKTRVSESGSLERARQSIACMQVAHGSGSTLLSLSRRLSLLLNKQLDEGTWNLKKEAGGLYKCQAPWLKR